MPRIPSDPVSLPNGRGSFSGGGAADLCSQAYPDERTTGENVETISTPSSTSDDA